jgi:hypothetical protein
VAEESESCLARQAMNSDKIGAEYRSNNKMIVDHIEKMINNPECIDVKDLLLKYKSDLNKWSAVEKLAVVCLK